MFIRCTNDIVKTRFKKLAKENFDDNYEVTLRWLLDCSEGLFADRNEELNAKIDILADEINKLKASMEKPKEETPKRVMFDGKKF